MRLNRKISVLLAFLLIFVMLFTSAFIIAEADHHCCGEDCHICALILICEQMLKRLSLFVMFATLIAVSVIGFCLIRIYFSRCVNTTLVALSVKITG